MANVAPFHFDQSTFELYAAPLAGAAAVSGARPVLRFPASVSALLERERVTTWYSVPTILRQLLERGALDRARPLALRWVLFGGEVFPPGRSAALMALLPDARFSNVYGPAEVNQCTFHHLSAPPVGDDPIPIGAHGTTPSCGSSSADGVTLDGAGAGRTARQHADGDGGLLGSPRPGRAGVRLRVAAATDAWYRTGDVVERDATAC